MFDTIGTVIGVAEKADLLDEDGNLPRVGRVLMADAIGTVAGSMLGTSTVTSFVESSSGVAEGGKTGLTAMTTGILFLVALFLSPIFLAIPSFATAPALVIVGFFMASSIKKMEFDGDLADAVGGYLAFLMMPLTYSIANGIMFGVLAWFIIKVCTGQLKKDSSGYVYRMCTVYYPCNYNYYLIRKCYKQHKKCAPEDHIRILRGIFFTRATFKKTSKGIVSNFPCWLF